MTEDEKVQMIVGEWKYLVRGLHGGHISDRELIERWGGFIKGLDVAYGLVKIEDFPPTPPKQN